MNTELDRSQTDETPAPTSARRTAAPAIDIASVEGAFILRADVPGVSREGLHLEVEQGVLSLRAEPTERIFGRALSAHRGFPTWERTFALPRGVDTEHIEATLDAGVLTVRIPLAASDAPRRIEIGAA